METTSQNISPRLRIITGAALLASALGTLFDAYSGPEGSIGLIPLYFGFPVGAVGLVLIYRKRFNWTPTLLLAIGLAGILYFMGAYPNGVPGWGGAVLIGIAHLYLPLPGRFAAVLWVTVGILGLPDFRAFPRELFLQPFYIFGLAQALSGAYMLWGAKDPEKDE